MIHKVTTTHEAITRITVEVSAVLRMVLDLHVTAGLHLRNVKAGLNHQLLELRHKREDAPLPLQMCEDMAKDNVIYAEIRTTPKVSSCRSALTSHQRRHPVSPRTVTCKLSAPLPHTRASVTAML